MQGGTERGGLEDRVVALEGGPVATGLSLRAIRAASPQRGEAERIPAVLQANCEPQAPAVTRTLGRYTRAQRLPL